MELCYVNAKQTNMFTETFIHHLANDGPISRVALCVNALFFKPYEGAITDHLPTNGIEVTQLLIFAFIGSFYMKVLLKGSSEFNRNKM